MMNFSSKEYLPSSEERVAHLRKIIAGRPVAILASGPSIQELEQRIEELRDADICYLGINKFFVQEKYILQKINKRFSVVSLSGREGMVEAIDGIIDFLKRDEDNMFLSSFGRDAFGMLDRGFRLDEFLKDYNKKLIFFSSHPKRVVPNHDQPLHFVASNSLLILIQIALIGKASSIVLFGADGHGGTGNNEYYYRQREYELSGYPGSVIHESLMNDTRHLFNYIASIAIRNTRKAYNLPLVNILNCSPRSFYTPFPKISYAEALEYLRTGNKQIGKLDLRTPQDPKAPNELFVFIEKILIFLRKHGWSSVANSYAK